MYFLLLILVVSCEQLVCSARAYNTLLARLLAFAFRAAVSAVSVFLCSGSSGRRGGLGTPGSQQSLNPERRVNFRPHDRTARAVLFWLRLKFAVAETDGTQIAKSGVCVLLGIFVLLSVPRY